MLPSPLSGTPTTPKDVSPFLPTTASRLPAWLVHRAEHGFSKSTATFWVFTLGAKPGSVNSMESTCSHHGINRNLGESLTMSRSLSSRRHSLQSILAAVSFPRHFAEVEVHYSYCYTVLTTITHSLQLLFTVMPIITHWLQLLFTAMTIITHLLQLLFTVMMIITQTAMIQNCTGNGETHSLHPEPCTGSHVQISREFWLPLLLRLVPRLLDGSLHLVITIVVHLLHHFHQTLAGIRLVFTFKLWRLASEMITKTRVITSGDCPTMSNRPFKID